MVLYLTVVARGRGGSRTRPGPRLRGDRATRATSSGDYPTTNQFWPSITNSRTSFRYFWGQVGSFGTTATAP